ncbi:MAG TPA: hypothetical protein VF815_28845 [Myxococcaceae bacterium]
MKIHRLLPLLVALAGLTGCPEEPCFSGGGVIVTPQPPGMILVGEETTLRVSPNLGFSDCGSGEIATPESLTVEVYDPDNQLVENESSLGNPSTNLSTLRFTATKPGRHHVFVAFDPVGGIQQFDFYAALDHSKQATALTVPQPCTSLERTQQGALVCDLDVLRHGTYVQRFTNSLLAVAGDVIWVVNGMRIQRYVDTGSALTLMQTLENVQGTPEAVHGSENELVVAYNSVLQRFTVSGTGLSTTGTAPWISSTLPVSNTGNRLLMVRTGDRLGIITRTSPSTTNTPSYQVCAHRNEGGRFLRTPEPCSSFTGVLVGYEADGLWVGDPQPFSEVDFTGLRYLQWTATGMAEQASLPLGFNLKLRTRPFYWRQTAVPTVTSMALSGTSAPLAAEPIYSSERKAILFEHMGPELFEASASKQLFWANQFPSGPPSNGLRVLVRPSH